MSNKKVFTQEQINKIVNYYRTTARNYRKTAVHFGIGINRIRKILRENNAYYTTSEQAKLRTGKKNPFYGKTHNEITRKRISNCAKKRQGKLNPNYKHGNYKRRPKDYKLSEFNKIRDIVYARDKYTCVITGQVGGELNAHHLIPFWICEESYFDVDNIITVSRSIHFSICHNYNWQKFNVDLIPDSLLNKYNLHRERLSELAELKYNSEATVRPSDIHKTEESDRNDQIVSE